MNENIYFHRNNEGIHKKQKANIMAERPPLMVAFIFCGNLLVVFYTPWYIGLAVTLLSILFFDKYIYAVLLFFSLFEVKFLGYLSIYNIASIAYILIYIMKIASAQKKIKYHKKTFVFFSLIAIYLGGVINTLFFFPYPINIADNLLNGMLNLIKVLVSLVLFLDLSSYEKEELESIFLFLMRTFSLGILVLFIYFLDSANTFSVYSRHAIKGVNANDFAARLAVISTATFLSLVSQKINLFNRIVALNSTGVALYMIFLTGSRTGLISVCLSMFFILILAPMRKIYKLTSICLTSTLFYIAFLQWGQDILHRTISSSSLSSFSTGRLNIWIALLRAVNNGRILFGYGVGRNTISVLSYVYGGYAKYDHNILLSALISFGVVGLLIYGIFLFKPIFFAVRHKFQNEILLLPFSMCMVSVVSGMFLCWVFEEVLLYTASISLATSTVLLHGFVKTGKNSILR